jgi:hypothetical protein
MSFHTNLQPAEGIAPSWICKDAGFKSLREVSDLIGQRPETLQYWYKTKPNYFMRVLKKAAREHGISE